MTPDPLVLLVVLLLTSVALTAGAAAVASRRELRALRRAITQDGTERSSVGGVVLGFGELQQAADALGVGLVRIDRAGRIVAGNEAGHRLLGWKPGALVGKSTMEGFVDHRIEELTRRARSGAAGQIELASADEPQLTLVVRARPARDGAVWVVLEDVSELRRLRRIRAEFIDNLSHELRTPLTTVRLLAESLALELERTELPPRIRESIVQIDVETGQLVQMVNELLDLAKIEQGEAPLQLAEVDLGEVIERTLERLRLYAERQGVRLHGEVPATAGERTILGDGQRIGQLLTNLVHNAVKFSPAGGDVTVRLRPEAGSVIVEVQDQGVGIPRQELERIFERFYKVDRARSREGGGTGLGLAIARHIVERHGGSISAESTEGVGSRFFVTLPRQPEG
ncbi:MAG: cell wall metabolism sensor histidine kinase WalK [Chloroflexota bacterium]|nr:cell wall metabolism sensor histidine kinase WalK [Chloroflexota bacterium]